MKLCKVYFEAPHKPKMLWSGILKRLIRHRGNLCVTHLPIELHTLHSEKGLDSPEDDLVHLLNERLNDANLGGHLGSTHNSHEGSLGLLNCSVEVVQLLLQQEACH